MASSSEQLRQLELRSYYSVVRALFACGRLETFENEMLLTDLAESLNISEQDRLAFLLKVKQDEVVLHLNSYGAEEAPGAAAAAGPSAPESHLPVAAAAPRAVAPPAIAIPAYQSPFVQPAAQPLASSKSKKKGASMAPPGGVSKTPSAKKSKSLASAPSTPRSLQPKGSFKMPTKPLVGAAAAAQQISQQKHAQQEWDRLTVREREIFESLLSLGVSEMDPELNEVHRTLLQWYRLEARAKQIIHDLNQPDMVTA